MWAIIELQARRRCGQRKIFASWITRMSRALQLRPRGGQRYANFQKRKRKPTVGSTLLHWRYPFVGKTPDDFRYAARPPIEAGADGRSNPRIQEPAEETRGYRGPHSRSRR